MYKLAQGHSSSKEQKEDFLLPRLSFSPLHSATSLTAFSGRDAEGWGGNGKGTGRAIVRIKDNEARTKAVGVGTERRDRVQKYLGNRLYWVS